MYVQSGRLAGDFVIEVITHLPIVIVKLVVITATYEYEGNEEVIVIVQAVALQSDGDVLATVIVFPEIDNQE